MPKVSSHLIMVSLSLLLTACSHFMGSVPYIAMHPKNAYTDVKQTAKNAYDHRQDSAYAGQDAQVVYFKYDNSIINGHFKHNLETMAQNITDNNNHVRLEGNTDERGSREYNVALGWKRAKAVEHFLLSQGVSKDQIEVISYGKEKPADHGHNPNAWAKNRRVEIVVSAH